MSLVLSLMILACGDSTGPGNGTLVGTWDLTSVNGTPVPSGVFLTWTFTASTMTSTDESDRDEAGSYTASGGVLHITVASVSGSECDDEVGLELSFPYSLDGSTLTVTVQDPDIGTGTFVFSKRG